MKMNSKKKILLGLYISILIVFLVNFIFAETNELFIYGAEIGEIFSNLSLAYIASYIFYRIVVVEREKEIRKTVYKSVNQLTKKLLFNGFYIIDVLAENEKQGRKEIHKRRKTISESEYKELCKKINPNSLSRFSEQINQLELKNNTKIESIHIQCVKSVKNYLEKIYTFLPYLEDENIEILNEIRDSELIGMDNQLFFARTNTDFKVFENYMYDYFKIILKLENYYESKIKSFA
ncbi:hypothetical protein [Winogradskyella vidalii]|uniref:hypothetical protein n=1 Tax=Winogradskyella vidalii TaxID=2615024 RepID=UPI0015CCD208|nr:hypothetical protein [Winogradskyella vidalii]